MECARVLRDLELSGSGRVRHIGRARRSGSERALPELRTDPEQCLCVNSGRRATRRGFHDVTLVDMTEETAPPVSMGEMGDL